jgi:hypothetical protein
VGKITGGVGLVSVMIPPVGYGGAEGAGAVMPGSEVGADGAGSVTGG